MQSTVDFILIFQVTYVFDNESTIFFAVFMSLWGKLIYSRVVNFLQK